ncbi:MAG TPA: RNB domain-containing ribonuclease [Candidatus Acidoferrales bacterium]|nr:RNB domain-containing ribonuclease [Candidatus Acidoferrales bacterium]
MARRDEVSGPDILAYLAGTNSPASARSIAAALELRHAARRVLKKVLAKLKRKGEIEELPGGRYRLPSGKPPQQKTAQPVQQARAPGGPPVRPADPNLITGRFVAHRDGYGFVVPEKPIPEMEGDLFIGRDALGDAMHGDRVLARIERRSRPAAGTAMLRAEGRILRVLDRTHLTVVGLFRYGAHGNTVLPYDVRLLHEIIIPPGQELTPALRAKLGFPEASAAKHTGPRHKPPRVRELDGAVVNVELTRFPSGGVAPSGRVIEILGRPGELGVDIEIIIRKHHLPHAFSGEVQEEAVRVAQPVGEEAVRGREDFRHLPIVTIDGETARDFDDAVYVEKRAHGGWHLQVHIADVAHYVARGGALDGEAGLRGTSVYFPDRAVPMLPEALSNEICSLKPEEDRLVMSALMEFDPAGRMTSARFTPGVIRSAARMTYTNVFKTLEGDAEMAALYAPLAPHFRNMRDLALLLNAQRVERGSIDFDLPEPIIEFDAQQRMVSIGRSVRNIAHRLIEEFMLAANRAVASYLEKRAVASLHRVHEKPDAKKVLEFEELAHAFGYTLGIPNLTEQLMPVRHGRVPAPARPGRPDSLGHGRERPMRVSLPGALELDVRPEHYQRLTRKLAGKPEERIVSYLMLRSLKQARYSADSLGHFALAFDQYTHFTSPIRRYPDLMVHRALKWALEHPDARPAARQAHSAAQGTLELGPYRPVELEEVASESSEAERRADAAERELMDWKTAQFMESRLGEEYDALIISVQKFGFFVELLEIFVEGLVPLSALEEAAGGRCAYRDRDHAIVALGSHSAQRGPRRGKPAAAAAVRIWRLGDRIRVRAERIDPIRRRVEFALA